MEQENTKTNARSSVKQLYCSPEVAEAVNNHRWFDFCFTGADRAQRMLEALNFAADHKAEYESGDYKETGAKVKSLQTDVERLKAENQKLTESAEESAAKEEKLNARIFELETDLQKVRDTADTTEEGNMRLAEEIRLLKETIASKDSEIEALRGEAVGWTKISTAYDPAYAAVVEEITRRLNAKYHHDAAPHDVLMSFFMRYYYKQEAEFRGMPFVIRPREIMALIRDVYPEMTDKILSKALGTI